MFATRLCAAVMLLTCATAGGLDAQPPRPSQHGSVTQQIAHTSVTVDYNRPVARGRALFGALVPWGKVWCPGADNCTTIELSTPVRVNGEALAGRHLLAVG